MMFKNLLLPRCFLFVVFGFAFAALSAQTYSVSATADICGSPSSSCSCDQNSSTTITDPDGAVRAQIRTYSSGQNVEIRFSKPSGGVPYFLCNARVRIYNTDDIDSPIVNTFLTLRCNNTSSFDVGIPANELPSSDGESLVYLVAFDNNPTGSGTDCDGNFCSSTPCAVPLVNGQSNQHIVLSYFTVTRNTSSNGPDVEVTSVSVRDEPVVAGVSNRLEVEYENVSNFLIESTEVIYTIDGVEVGDDSDGSLSPGSTQYESLGYTFENPGSYTYCATVLPVENETNIGNNDMCITVNVEAPPSPVMEITDLFVTANPATVGQQTTLNVSYINTGGSNANDLYISYRIDGVEVSADSRSFLAPNSPRSSSDSYTFPAAGTYTYTVVISSDNAQTVTSQDYTVVVTAPSTPAEFSTIVGEYVVSEPEGTTSSSAVVLFLYTADGMALHSGTVEELVTDIARQVDDANFAFSESNIDLDLTIADILPINYVEENGEEDDMIIELLDTNDGVLDELDDLQEMYAADIIVMVTGELSMSGGVSCYRGPATNSSIDPVRCGTLNIALVEGDNVSRTRNLTTDTGGSFIVAHEIGHIFGAGHFDADENFFPVLAKGDVSTDGSLRTVMTYRSFGPSSVRAPVFSGMHNYPGTLLNAGSDEDRNNSLIIDSNISTVINQSTNRVLVQNTGGQDLIINSINPSDNWINFNGVSFPVTIGPGNEESFDFSINWNSVGDESVQATVTFNHNEGNSTIDIVANPFEESPMNFSTLSIGVVSSLVKGAEITAIRNGVSEVCGYTNAFGEVVCITSPALRAGDQIQVGAAGYEPLTITLTNNMLSGGHLNLPVMESGSSSLPVNPYLSILSDRFTSGSSVTVSAGASSNVTQTQVRSNGGGWQTISPGGSTALPLVSGPNLIEARITGSSGNTIITERVFKLAGSDLVDAVINVPSGIDDICFYVSDMLVEELSTGTNTVRLPATAVNYRFKKRGYDDLLLELHAPTIPVNLSMSPRAHSSGSKTLYDFSVEPVQYAERGVTVMYEGSESLTVTRENASFADPAINPFTQTVEVEKSGADDEPITLKVSYDQATVLDLNNISVLIEYNGAFNEVTPAEFGNSISLDDLNQVLTFSGLNGGERITIIEDASFLPVDLLYFVGELDEDGLSLLSWSTSNEVGFSHFEVQHSLDAGHFANVGKVKSNSSGNYGFTHQPAIGRNYYRLKMIDHDDTYQMSTIIMIYNDGKGVIPNLNLFPNPASNELTALLPETIWLTTLEVYTMDGKKLQTFDAPQQASEATIDIGNLPTGTYYLRVTTNQTTYNEVFIKR